MSTNTANWHRFLETDDGDDQCDSCGVVVSFEAHLSFTLPCPSPDCGSRSNPDRGCVMAPGRGQAAACVYCGRPGARGDEGPTPDPEFDALMADMLGDDA